MSLRHRHTFRLQALTVLISLITACGSSSSDDAADDATATTSPAGGTAETGTLAVAYPGDLALASAFVADSEGASLNLATSPIESIDDPQSPSEKEATTDSILEATGIASCFKLVLGSFSQPGCFAPNVQKSEVDADSDFVITMPSGVNQQLYGDGGMVKAKESTESCTAATINYFTEDAIQYIEQGKQLFASVVCASRFADMELPTATDTEPKDYLTALADINLGGATFTKATMSYDGAVYTTQLAMDFELSDEDRKIYAYFRHDPEADKGHVIVMQAGVADSLQAANQTNLTQDQNQNQQGGEQQNNGPKIAVVAVQYEVDDTVQKVQLDRANFVSAESTKHPANFITASGRFDLEGIAEVSASHGVADNIVSASFVQNPDEDTAGHGIIGWTASLSDSFWRSFAYTVAKSSTGAETAKATFGFSPSYKESAGTVTAPSAGLGMFCNWAQQNNGSNNAGSTFLEASGLSGPALDKVQYQVSTRSSMTAVFDHDATSSHLAYRIAPDCGTVGTDQDLSAIDASGNIDGTGNDGFTIPSPGAPSILGGVSLDVESIDLTID